MDFRKQQREHAPIHIDRTAVEKVESFKFLGVHITDNLKRSTHTDGRLKKFGLAPKTITNFYRCTIEISARYCNSSARNRKALKLVVRCAQHGIGGTLPALQDTTASDVTGRPKRSSTTSTT